MIVPPKSKTTDERFRTPLIGGFFRLISIQECRHEL